MPAALPDGTLGGSTLRRNGASVDRQLQVKQLSRGQPAELIRWTTWRNRSSVGRQLQIKQLGRRQPAGLIRRRYFRLGMIQLLSSCQPLLGRCVLRSMHSIRCQGRSSAKSIVPRICSFAGCAAVSSTACRWPSTIPARMQCQFEDPISRSTRRQDDDDEQARPSTTPGTHRVYSP